MRHLSQGLKVVKNDESIIEKTLIGGGLLMLSMLVVPALIYYGYLMRVLKETGEESFDGLPDWGDWSELTKDGLISMLFVMLFMVPAYILIYLPFFIEGGNILILLGYVLLFGISYFIPALLTLLMRDGWEAVTDLDRVKAITFTKDYFSYMLMLVFVNFIIGVGVFVFMLITFGLGMIATPFIMFPINAWFMYVIGKVVTDTDPQSDLQRSINTRSVNDGSTGSFEDSTEEFEEESNEDSTEEDVFTDDETFSDKDDDNDDNNDDEYEVFGER